MKAVILVGGQGTRLLPLTCKTPKAMVPILNRPFLEHQLLHLKKHGVDEVILAMGYLPDPIQQGLGDGSNLGIRLIYSVEPSAMGTAGAVKYAAKYLEDGPFFVFNGDVITEIDLTTMMLRHHDNGPKASLALTPVDNPSRFGVVETDERGNVRRFIEKPPPGTETTNMINAGIYILEPDVLNYMPENAFCMFENSVFPQLLKEGKPVLAYPSNAYWIDIGTPATYLKVQYDLLAKLGSRVVNQGRSHIHAKTVIEGPVIIGRGCTIEKAHIKGPSVIGAGCLIKRDVYLEKTIIWPESQIAETSTLKGCIIDSNCIIGKGSEILEECIIGDNVTLGPGCKVAPGTKIWPDRKLAPGSELSGNVGKPS
jgi:mannose-1-phosphate guanylyltransferase